MLDREQAMAWYRRNRERSRMLFDLVSDDACYARPIALRHPVIFYEGHLPAFSFNTLVKNARGRPGIDARLESLFARGIDPDEVAAGGAAADPTGRNQRAGWPSRDEVHAFVAEADRRVLDELGQLDPDRAEAAFTILEHEAMHHETLLYMWHRLPYEEKRRPAGYMPRVDGDSPPEEWIELPGGRVPLGVDRDRVVFGWDNEFPRYEVDVAPFSMERHNVTNERFLEFLDAGGYTDPQWWRSEDWRWICSEGISHPLFWERLGDSWWWRGMFERVPLPRAWPVYVSYAEAAAYARWRKRRLPSEAEYQHAAFGTIDAPRPHPWGSACPSAEHGVFNFSSWDPEPAGSHPAGRSAWGIDDLVGNGWEWTSTPFGPFPGFRAMPLYPEYSADFFDGEHMVMKGASPATAAEFLRPTFRNWFRPRYPYVYASFRCVTTRAGRG